jgi:hypothetical protein
LTLFVAKAPGATLTEADVIAHCREEMRGYKGAEERALCRGAFEVDGRKDPAPGVARR